ncbi:hypothetical protein KDK95_16150 [Actinospica sp. MGRD01-02]|uniref:Uncharacterized protein n=1 Tax=Actinospica acidithermotolerans TaxID=2828514 RepID=A0A941EAW7_9ACTN|nr:hypothetical protein [Actinospica acidithermotolerans]MBR7827852.1 hypothetical protein [Actinospica acidithermotolerans]
MIPELPAGDPARRLADRATAGTLGLALLFMLFTWPAKKVPELYLHEPWQDDPYDALISLSIFWVPLMAALCLTRVLPWRRTAPQPIRRTRELLRASRVLLAVITATLASDWISVALRVHEASWTGATAAAVAGLAAVSLAALATARALRRASRQPLPQADGPDWLTDMISLGDQVAARVGPMRPPAARTVLLADRLAVRAVRRHPLLVAGGLSLAFGFTTALAQGLQEGYTLGVYLVLFINHAAGMFAYLALIGAFLGIAGTPPQQRATTRSASARRRTVRAGIAACVSIPVAGAFRAQLWSLISRPERLQPYELITLMLGAAVATAALTYATETIAGRSGRRRPERPQP